MSSQSKKYISIFSLIFLCLAGGYIYLWFHAAEVLENLLLSEISRLEKEGYAPSYDRIEVKGFPLKLEVRFTDPSLQVPHLSFLKIISHGILTASASVWNPQLVTLKSNDKISLSLAEDEEENKSLASLDALQAQFPLTPSASQQYSFDLYGVRFKDWNSASIKVTFLRDAQHSQSILGMSLYETTFDPKITKLYLPPKIQELRLEANIALPTKVKPDLVGILRSYYDQDITLDVNQVHLLWGDLKIDGNGSISVDQDLQPLAAFSLEITGIDTLLNSLVKQKIIQKHTDQIIKLVLQPFTKDKGKGTSNTPAPHQLSISVQDRVLSIGPVPIWRFDKINWNGK